ncbi:DUF6804 family protein [Flavobacterium sp.]|uniref:DUF6804 family protein n=1 Tax=Flavobacterium sp. TaxID=239 RepID=UPI0025E7B95E|nr:DUF6804 family protein [Flavobacterium sp.]
MSISVKIIVKLVLVILFLCCLLDMPYSYFQLVRFLGMTGFVWLAYQERNSQDKTILIIWAASALLINPFIKISLGRTVWNAIDVVWALILILTIWKDTTSWRKKNGS